MQNPDENTRYCLEMVRKDDGDRYFAALFAPRDAQAGLFALFAFNQEVAKTRETVSEPMLGEIRLQWWQEALDGLSEGRVREHPVVQALAEIPGLPAVLPLMAEVLEARRQDMYDEGLADFAALEAYADGVGGALSEAAQLICWSDAPVSARKAARASGRAWAMLGLVRALPYHWQSGRNYVPQSEADPSAFQDADKLFVALEPVLASMLQHVGRALDESREQVAAAGKKAKPALAINGLSKLYLKQLAKVGNNPFKLPDVEPSSLRRLLALLAASFRRRP